MGTRKKNKLVKEFRKLFLSEDDRYVVKRVDLEKEKVDPKNRFILKTVGDVLADTGKDHALNLSSYLRLIVPKRLQAHLCKCDFIYLIRGDEEETFDFLKKNNCQTSIIIRNKFAKKRFERFFLSYNRKSDKTYCGFYNIASRQRLQHYEQLLKLIYGRKISKRLYKVLYPNEYLNQLKRMLKNCREAQKIIVGYKENVKKEIQKKFKQNPDIDVEDDYFSLSYYRKEKLIITGHAFGWMMKEILSLIIRQTKVKQLFYIGNCGAFNNLKVGQIIFPNNLFYFRRKKLVINNILSPKDFKIVKHLSVPTPLIETDDFIAKNCKIFSTVDVELYDIVSEVSNVKANLLLGVILLVSDRPGKKENSALVSDEYRFQRSLRDSVERVVRFAMPE